MLQSGCSAQRAKLHFDNDSQVFLSSCAEDEKKHAFRLVSLGLIDNFAWWLLQQATRRRMKNPIV